MLCNVMPLTLMLVRSRVMWPIGSATCSSRWIGGMSMTLPFSSESTMGTTKSKRSVIPALVMVARMPDGTPVTSLLPDASATRRATNKAGKREGHELGFMFKPKA